LAVCAAVLSLPLWRATQEDGGQSSSTLALRRRFEGSGGATKEEEGRAGGASGRESNHESAHAGFAEQKEVPDALLRPRPHLHHRQGRRNGMLPPPASFSLFILFAFFLVISILKSFLYCFGSLGLPLGESGVGLSQPHERGAKVLLSLFTVIL
jgi:hypothetical protein